MFDRQEMLSVFLSEANEELQKLEIEILALENKGYSDKNIQSIFRVAHTLKGSSAAMGFADMKQLTHEMEDVLDSIRNGRLKVSTEVVDVLFDCLDILTQLKNDVEASGAPATPIGAIVERLQRIGLAGTAGPAAAAEALPQPAAVELSGAEHALLAEALRKGGQAYACRIVLADDCEMKLVRCYVLLDQLKACSTVIRTAPELKEELIGDTVTFVIVSVWTADALAAWLRGLMDVAEAHVTVFAAAPAAMQEAPHREAGGAEQPGAAAAAGKEGDGRKASQTIRVGVERIEKMMNLVGELVIDQTRITQLGNLLRDSYPADDNVGVLEQVSNHFTRVISELQESVMKTRMLPIGQLYSRFPRMVRDLSHSLSKDVHLIVEGEETELDRTVIEEIGDPLIHLLRNAIDHGIESRDERLRAGKPLVGTVRMTAVHQENQVVLTVEDDGAGIDPVKIKQSAVRKGLLSQQQADALTDHECTQLVFLPGFSTSAEISDISGRGVGMDIVRSHIEKLNGLIDVRTRPGQGTSFVIKLPLTLAILRGLLIKLNSAVYALPMGSVVEIVRYSIKDIYSLKGQPAVKNREQVVPLLWLHDHFHLPRKKRVRDHVFVVIIGIAEKRIGLIVDELLGNQEIVVKSVGSYIGKVDGVSGATILGDGSVALILDVTGIFQLASQPKGALLDNRVEAG